MPKNTSSTSEGLMPAFSTAALMEWAPNCVADKEERDLEVIVSGRPRKTAARVEGGTLGSYREECGRWRRCKLRGDRTLWRRGDKLD